MKIEIKYNGCYPNLCSGKLIAIIDGKEWIFPPYCLSSGGGATINHKGDEEVYDGEWIISEYPKDFPEELKPLVENAVNDEIPYGCCGGCI